MTLQSGRLASQRRLASTLKGNGVIGIRREDKNEWERRVPLTPQHVSTLVNDGLKVLVQPSSIRAFSNEEYAEAGGVVIEDLSEANTIVAVKEVPVECLIPERTYMMFSHTHKAQPYNMPLLDEILRKNIRLIDFERIAGEEGRVVKFGPFAGFAGTIDTLHALGVALLAQHFATPFLHVSHAKEYKSLEAARENLIDVGNTIRKRGLPKEIGPLTFVVTGTGSVSQAAQQILHHLPCQYVEASALKALHAKTNFDNKTVYVCVVTAKDMVRPKKKSQSFDKEEYYAHPERYVPTFHESVAPYASAIINGMYWEDRFPRLLTLEQTKTLYKTRGRLPTLVLGDITCDPFGSIEFFTKSTSIAHPLYCYDPATDTSVDFEHFSGQGPLIVGVDHLPAEFPMEASDFFGTPLVPLVKEVATNDGTVPWEVQEKSLPAVVANGVIACHGKLTPKYGYIEELRQKRESVKVEGGKRNVLILGAGMVSGPAVEYILRDKRNSVTLADASVKAAQAILDEYAGDSAHAGRDAAGRNQSSRAVALDVSHAEHLDTLVKQADLVVSLVPWTLHPTVMKTCIDRKVPVVTASYVSPPVQDLHADACAANVTILNEMGLDPGIDIMSSLQMLAKIRRNGGVVRSYESYCGALPEPEASRNCLGYKFSWSPKGVLLAATRPCTFLWKDRLVDLAGPRLYDFAQPFTAFRGLHMEWVPNGNALGYKDVYDLQDAHTIVRATLRYRGFSTAIRALRELGMLDPNKVVEELKKGGKKQVSWGTVLEKLSGVGLGDMAQKLADDFARLQEEMRNAEEGGHFFDLKLLGSIEDEVTTALSALDELRLSDKHFLAPKVASGAVVDSLAETLNNSLVYEPHESDFVLMYHRVVAEYPHEQKSMVHESSLALRGTAGSVSATARTVGLPLGIGAQLVLDGVITKPGIVRPIIPEVYKPVMKALRKEGVFMNETEYILRA
ncbi:Alpha-aminoadipic semialdehyde synthase [Diplonema papillatum]|nr:Alpha-aminoadipic semialdehyde synthase [Diplonema papillatum]|eukprot:gene9513-14769_t